MFLYTDADNNPHHLVLVTYRMPQGFTPVVKCHGNSTTSTPFHPTWFSTKRMIKGKCTKEGPKSLVGTLSSQAGGMLEACAPGQLPRNEKQVTNYKSKALISERQSDFPEVSRDAAADDLFLVMQKCYSEDPLQKFVRAVNAAPEPAVVVTSDRQLQDLSRFCTAAYEFCPLTVDPTLNLGDLMSQLSPIAIFYSNLSCTRSLLCLWVRAVFITEKPSQHMCSLPPLLLVTADHLKEYVLLAQMENWHCQMLLSTNLVSHST